VSTKFDIYVLFYSTKFDIKAILYKNTRIKLQNTNKMSTTSQINISLGLYCWLFVNWCIVVQPQVSGISAIAMEQQ
jgi:hypothetical protein